MNECLIVCVCECVWGVHVSVSYAASVSDMFSDCSSSSSNCREQTVQFSRLLTRILENENKKIVCQKRFLTPDHVTRLYWNILYL